MNQLRDELFACTPRITPMRDTPQRHKIARERRGGVRDHGSAFAQTCGCVDEGVWHAHRRWAAPPSARSVEKLLDRDRLLVADVIDTTNAWFEDRRLGRTQKILNRQQLQQRRLFPHTE